MILDPLFYAAAVPAVLLFGISKGGFGGGLGTLAVPLMALTISPVQAAGILLPLLCLMDIVTLWKFRNKWVWAELRVLLPASLVGIGVGTFLFEYMSPGVIRLIIGAVAISFTLHYWMSTRGSSLRQLAHFPRLAGLLGGSAAGFTSFVAHAGGPPISMYLLRRPLNRTDFVATAALFFAVVNYVKLVPYAWLGQLDASNLTTSLVLSPLAPAGVLIGVYLHKRVTDRFFFAFVYVLLFLVGLRLIYDGLGFAT